MGWESACDGAPCPPRSHPRIPPVSSVRLQTHPVRAHVAASGARKPSFENIRKRLRATLATRLRPEQVHDHLRQSTNALDPYNKSLRAKAGDVAAFFCPFLGDHGVKPEKVLKKDGLEGADWADPDSVPALYKASTKFLPRTLRSDSDADSDADDYATGAASDSLMIASEFLFAFVGSVQGLFFFLYMFPLASYVEGTSLTTSLRYQDSRLEIS
jgi:hypothetical protein